MNLVSSAATVFGVCVWLSLAAGCGDTFSADYLQTIDENRDGGDVSAETSPDAPMVGDVPGAETQVDAATADEDSDGGDGVGGGPEETTQDAGGDTATGEVSAG